MRTRPSCMRWVPTSQTLLVARGAIICDAEAATAAVTHGSIVAVKTSPRWLAMSRTERMRADRGSLHHVMDTVINLDIVRSLVLVLQRWRATSLMMAATLCIQQLSMAGQCLSYMCSEQGER